MLHATSLKSPRRRVHRSGHPPQRVWLSSSDPAHRLSSPVRAVLRQIRRAKYLQRCIRAEEFLVGNRLTPPVMAVMDRPILTQSPATATAREQKKSQREPGKTTSAELCPEEG